MKTPSTIAIILSGSLLLGACAQLDGAPDEPEAQNPNPAADFCANEGGRYNLDNGNCQLEDGTVVDARDYYRRQNAPESQ